MKKIQKTFPAAIFICATLLHAQITFAQHPFKVQPPGDFIVAGLVLPLTFETNHLYKKKSTMSEQEISSLNVNDVNRFDRSATKNYSISAKKASDYLQWSCILLPFALGFDENIRSDAGTSMIIYFETIGITQIETNLLKSLVHRPRPFVYNPNAPMREKRKSDATCSFYSGHTAMSAATCFFAAGIYTGYKPGNEWVWAAAAVPPLVTGFFRYKSGKHFFTDVLVGFVVGAANGYLITTLHKAGKGKSE